MNSKLTVSLVTWNGAKYLPECLASLADQTFQDFDLVVTDNASADDSVNIIESYSNRFVGRIKVIKNSSNLGFAKPHNLAMKEALTPFVFLLNQDIILEPNYLKDCLIVFDEQPNAGAVSGKILRWIFAEENGLLKSQKTTKIDSLGLQIFKSQRVIERHVTEEDRGQFGRIEEVFGVSGTVPIYRKSALDAVAYNGQYFDEDFFAYKEDVDLAYRLRLAGFSAWVSGQAVAYHDRSAKSTVGLSVADQHQYRQNKPQFINYHSYKNHLSLLVKNLSAKNYLRYVLWIKGYELEKFFYFLIFEPKTLAALKEVWLKLPELRRKRKFILSNRKVTDKEISKWFI